MPLRIIKGPPNSGRTGLLQRKYVESLPRDPVLVVPSTDDIFTWEERLTRERGAFVGGQVVHFKDLVDELLAGDQTTSRPAPNRDNTASPLFRRNLTKTALENGWPGLARRLEGQPGLLDALLRLVDELRENLIDPDTLDDRIRGTDGRVPPELGRTYRSWVDLLAASGRDDGPQRAMEAVSAGLAGWEGRPVFVAGFDDLTVQQLTLLVRLSEVTTVVIAITHELGNRAMAVTERLLEELRGAGAELDAETDRSSQDSERDPLLNDLERALLDREADGTLEAADSLRFLRSSGRRGEAEHVGARVARLVADGTDPGEIAIAIESPATSGTVFRDVLTGFDLPVTLEAETPAPATTVGQSALNLMRAVSPTGSVEDLFAFARGPVGLDQDLVDEIELKARRAGVTLVDEVAGMFREHGSIEMLPGWDQARSGNATTAVRGVVEAAAHCLVRGNTGGALNSPGTETGMAKAIIEACDELDSIQGRISPAELADILRSDVIKVWAIPVAGTVTIASPYSLRAKRYEHLFICGLQERSLGDDGGGPFLTAAGRSSLELPDMTDPEDQDLYLFYSSVTVPTRSLTLSTRTSDVHGKAEFPSPLIDEVTRLFRDPETMVRRRSISEIVFPATEAPSRDELVRSVAAGAEVPEVADDDLSVLRERLELASAVELSTREFGPLEITTGLSSTFSASALEAFIECPYSWFFERALKPVRFGPEPEAIAKGSLIHQVLADLYSRHPGEIPGDENVSDWIAEAAGIAIEAADSDEIRLGTTSAAHRIERQRAMVEVSRFLKREAARPGTPFRPFHLERSFGMSDPDGREAPPVDFNGWNLRGRIDRIDISKENGDAVIFDYKSGKSSFHSLARMEKDGKVQLHLYARAAEGFEGVERVVAAVYLPVFPGDGRPRGVLSAVGNVELAAMGPFPKDTADDFEEEITRGVRRADTAARSILDGRILHRQGQCRKHLHHAGVPDWKLSVNDPWENDR